jgi:uncharacterized membrane protein
MAHRTLVLGMFDDELTADDAASSLRNSGNTRGDAIGVLALDRNGALKEDKVGARSTGKGAGVGAALWLLGPVGVGVGLVGGAAVGALHHKGLQLDGADRSRISSELTNGKAAVGVLTEGDDVQTVSASLAQLGGTTESHHVSDEQALSASGTDG